MGPIKNLLGMMPGMGQMRDQLDQIDDRDLDRVAAIIRSMTPAERQDPKIINGSRRARIARGSGVTVTEVSSLVTRFFDAQKMMKRMAGGMGIPGMPGGTAQGGKAQKKAKKGTPGQRRPAQGARSASRQPAGRAPQPQAGRGVLGNLGGSCPPGWSCRPASTRPSCGSRARSNL